jgi:hypothetical protein
MWSAKLTAYWSYPQEVQNSIRIVGAGRSLVMAGILSESFDPRNASMVATAASIAGAPRALEREIMPDRR